MEIVINGNNNKWKDTYGNKANIRYLPYNKISNIIYMVNYNLLLNILNTCIQEFMCSMQYNLRTYV